MGCGGMGAYENDSSGPNSSVWNRLQLQPLLVEERVVLNKVSYVAAAGEHASLDPQCEPLGTFMFNAAACNFSAKGGKADGCACENEEAGK